MRCPDVQDQLSAYLEAELSPPQARFVHEHLATCADCQTVADDLRTTVATLQRLPAKEPPPELAERVRAALEPAPRRAPWYERLTIPRWVPVPVGALATALVAVLVVQVVRVFGPSTPPPPLTSVTATTVEVPPLAQQEQATTHALVSKAPAIAAEVAATPHLTLRVGDMMVAQEQLAQLAAEIPGVATTQLAQTQFQLTVPPGELERVLRRLATLGAVEPADLLRSQVLESPAPALGAGLEPPVAQTITVDLAPVDAPSPP